jgi:hypothetical protein
LPSPSKVIILLSHLIIHSAFNLQYICFGGLFIRLSTYNIFALEAATDQAGSIALSIAEVNSFFLLFIAMLDFADEFRQQGLLADLAAFAASSVDGSTTGGWEVTLG